MAFELPELPYSLDALEPYMSSETLTYHHGKHHKKYVEELNKLSKGTRFEKMSLEAVVLQSEGKLFNNAAQAWNHEFFWKCLTPKREGTPRGALIKAFEKSFGSLENFKNKFTEEAIGNFGSGWTWLVERTNGDLSIESLSNAGNPMTHDLKPILACDVWEHAYYIDHRNERPKYLDAFWQIVNWDFVESRLRPR